VKFTDWRLLQAAREAAAADKSTADKSTGIDQGILG
jgi:hypothetical protein